MDTKELLKYFDERGKKICEDSIRWFKDHVAELKEFDGIQVVRFAKPGTVNFSMNVLYHEKFIHISGDVGEAVYDTTWKPNAKNACKNMGYFTGKLSCVYGGKYKWDVNDCIEDIEEWHKDTEENFDDPTSQSDIENIERLKTFVEDDLKPYCDNQYEFIAQLQSVDLDKWDETCESSLWRAGERLNSRLYTYWIALILISEQLNFQEANQ